ncbi:MAG: hypothetical protein ABI862_16890 [Ilumatobacteraceae bacterium]
MSTITTSSQSATIATRRRRRKQLLTGFIAAVATIGCIAPTASATVRATAGVTGPTQVFQGSCKYMRTNASGWLRTVTPPPRIWGINYNAGAGNDAQRVRYTINAIEVGTNRVLYNSGYSSLQWAYDNQPAPFTLSETIDVSNWRANFQVVYQIEWYNNNGQQLGTKLEVVDSYLYYSGLNVGPYGPVASCKKF